MFVFSEGACPAESNLFWTPPSPLRLTQNCVLVLNQMLALNSKWHGYENIACRDRPCRGNEHNASLPTGWFYLTSSSPMSVCIVRMSVTHCWSGLVTHNKSLLLIAPPGLTSLKFHEYPFALPGQRSPCSDVRTSKSQTECFLPFRLCSHALKFVIKEDLKSSLQCSEEDKPKQKVSL